MKYLFRSIAFCFVLISTPTFSQVLQQSIRGRVVDENTKAAAFGANIIIAGSDPILGSVTDIDGYFKITNVPIGRIELIVSFIGYESRVIPNVIVDSGKEVFVTIELVEKINMLKGVEVVGNNDKTATQNEMSLISTRNFSTDETERYAGTFSDPARMVVNYAGVSSDPDGNNDIIVRGNSSKGILWRLDGIEIPNPNHFSFEGGSGGGINALNSTMLTNSDFLTGAFAPEYGNATSGVFDIKLRQGNNEKHEYSFGMGVLGIDFAAEGPLKKGSRGSYLVNYRYSSLALLDQAGLVDFDGVPKYQDLSFKVYIPTRNLGIFSLFGVGGISSITEEVLSEVDNETVLRKTEFKGDLGAAGLTHLYLFNNTMYLRSSISVSQNGSGWDSADRWSNGQLTPSSNSKFRRFNTKAQSLLNKKIDPKNTIAFGAGLTLMNYNFKWKEDFEFEPIDDKINQKDKSTYFQNHFSWKHRFNENISMVSGLHFLYFNLNKSYSVEPRVSASWKVNQAHTFSAGIGVHSRLESLLNYTVNVTDSLGAVSQPNIDLAIPKSLHYILGYDFKFSRKAHLKMELYYQSLYDIGVENDLSSTFSLINQVDEYFSRPLISEGKGYNYGVELTLERFFNDNFYYLLTGSVFESKYKTNEGVWRPGRFSTNFNSNFLVGKEFRVGDKSKNKSISVDFKVTLIGGTRFTPVNEEASIFYDEEILYEDKPFSKRGDDIFITNISGRYKKNNPKTTHMVRFEILNATNNAAVTGEYYDSDLKKVVVSKQLELIPNIMYVLQF